MTFKINIRRIWEDRTWDEETVEIPGDPEWDEELLDMIGVAVTKILEAQAKYRKVVKLEYLGVEYDR